MCCSDTEPLAHLIDYDPSYWHRTQELAGSPSSSFVSAQFNITQPFQAITFYSLSLAAQYSHEENKCEMANRPSNFSFFQEPALLFDLPSEPVLIADPTTWTETLEHKSLMHSVS